MMLCLLYPRGIPLIMYTLIGGGVKASYTVPLRITCKKGKGGPDSMLKCVRN